MQPSNAEALTRHRKAINAKRKAKQSQVKEVLFDEDSRREFLTGFRKRKLERMEAGKKIAKEREKKERLQARLEQRRTLAARALENAREVESAYAGINDEDDEDYAPSLNKGKEREDFEFEDASQLATVTVVEDFTVDDIIGLNNGGPSGGLGSSSSSTPYPASAHDTSAPKSSKPSLRSKKQKTSQIKYETKAARRATQVKQKARRTEKSHLAQDRGKSGSSHKKKRK
ncbi:hypothetical protein SISSUDRAFT_982855 [Sistotremastrum suecicum HHB10207 ss-3]|uniref:Nucleolar protein 12 n=1 Tax=Sistotremastrum suecicum HHB10207 ss-3 TaxID=1314776 RepID=A0A166FMD6_9AGAM|nr:hypothetical protein SISSUDRAFT_982855 [Sistotremastrum suecicum HHB10207 ss-3]